jgi:5'-methylthioadenosine phosphorylase
MGKIELGIIGGSGLYDIEGIKNLKAKTITTPFGKPSDQYMIGDLNGKKIAFLPRHAHGHRITPTEINYRANIFGFKKLGVEKIVSVSAVGSMREDLVPGDLLVVDQFFDRTSQRKSTFFGLGLVAHVGMANPVCPVLSDAVYTIGQKLGFRIHRGGNYICIEGPQFSTKSESEIYRRWGVDVIGMTNVTEAKLAREAEICYSTLALITDYDVWHTSEATVSSDGVIKVLLGNVSKAKNIIKELVNDLPIKSDCQCDRALADAIITARERISAKTKRDLQVLVGKYLK